MKTLVQFFLDPFHIFLLLALAAAVTGWAEKKAWFKRFTAAAVVWLMITSTGFIPGWMLKSLEYRYLPADREVITQLQGTEPYIVVLGAGHGFYESHPANVLLVPYALSRLAEGIRLQKALPGSKLVLSGYSAVGGVTSAGMKAQAALLLGVEAENLMVQNEPVNTFEEAALFSDRFGDSKPVLLVTSAAHMPRAAMLFGKCGVNVIPSPGHYRITNPDKFHSLLPSFTYMAWFRIVLHEYAATVRDRLRTC